MKCKWLRFLLMALPMVAFGAQTILHDGIDDADKSWKNLDKRFWVPDQGRNNSAALAGERIKGEEKRESMTFRRSIPGLQPGRIYKFSAYLKAKDGLTVPDVRFGVETRSRPGRKFVSICAARPGKKEGEWQKCEGEFATIPKNPEGVTGYDYEIIVNIRNGKYGRFLIDDISVTATDKVVASLDTIPEAQLRDKTDPGNLVLNSGFEYGVNGWRNLKKEILIPGAGVGGTTALAVENKPGQSRVVYRNRMKLAPCTKYDFGASIRLETGTELKQVKFGVEARSTPENRWGGYTFASKKGENGPWLDFRGQITTFADNGSGGGYVYDFIIYVQENTVGKFYVDNVFLKAAGSADMPRIPTVLNYPAGGHVDCNGSELTLTSASGTANGKGIWKITDAGGRVVKEGNAVFRNRTVNIQTGPLKPGTYRVSIASEAEKNDYSLRNSLQLIVHEQAQACYLDEYGRAISDGKPFMPLGFFCYSISDKQLAILKDSPFNTLLSYSTWNPKFDLDHVMEALAAQNMKMILSLKDFYDLPKDGGMLAVKKYKEIDGCDNIVRHMVEKYRRHPALLAYYTCDERPVGDWKPCVERKELLNRLDPSHPVYAVHCTPGEFPFYGCWQDVFGCDSYPIGQNSNHAKALVETLVSARKVARFPKGVGYWMVPQYFNWAGYRNEIPVKERYAKFRWPTETEALTFGVLGAIHGARGFIFFNFSDMFRADDPVKFEQTWPAILNVGKTLKMLEPWIMSVVSPEPVTLEKVGGKVHTARFVNDKGKVCIMLAAEGPGEASAVFKAPAGLHSLRGVTIYQGGAYRFSGKDIDCDILVER